VDLSSYEEKPVDINSEKRSDPLPQATQMELDNMASADNE
jgi:hypothetical protein